jgi:hypothetical protein
MADARFEDLRDRYAGQVVPASRIRRTFFDFEGRPPHKPPGNHVRCGKALRWVWVD